MQATIQTDDLGTDIYAEATGAPRLDGVAPDGVVAADAEQWCLDTEPGTVMLSALDRHRQLEIVTRRLVEVARARRAHLS